MDERLRCFKCARLTIQDDGYSDYTVTGTELNCGAGKFRDLDEEEENIIFEVAKKCEYFHLGNPIEITLEGEVSLRSFEFEEDNDF